MRDVKSCIQYCPAHAVHARTLYIVPLINLQLIGISFGSRVFKVRIYNYHLSWNFIIGLLVLGMHASFVGLSIWFNSTKMNYRFWHICNSEIEPCTSLWSSESNDPDWKFLARFAIRKSVRQKIWLTFMRQRVSLDM